MPTNKLLYSTLQEARNVTGIRTQRASVNKLIDFYKLDDLPELIKQFRAMQNSRVFTPSELVQLKTLHILIGQIVNYGLF